MENKVKLTDEQFELVNGGTDAGDYGMTDENGPATGYNMDENGNESYGHSAIPTVGEEVKVSTGSGVEAVVTEKLKKRKQKKSYFQATCKELLKRYGILYQ